MTDTDVPADLLAHLCGSLGLDRPEARRLIIEVTTYFHETSDAYAIRRHQELQKEGVPNSAAFERIATELTRYPVRAQPLTQRQIRRIIYG